MSTVNVFTYGSLMFSPVWESVCVGRYKTQKMLLRDFRRYCVQNESYPAVVPQLGASVEGIVYFDVSFEDQLKLNQFEGEEYVLRHHQIDDLDVVFYEFVALGRIEKRDWSPTEFELNQMPAFLSRHVGSFLQNGTRSGVSF
jgi:gamma-glutamylcyclotransferase (GGCT)/AIG2-like uncharacterized protein YtfP